MASRRKPTGLGRPFFHPDHPRRPDEAATTGELELDRIYDSLSKLEERDVASREFTQWEERFQFPLGLAIALLLIDFALPERVRARRDWEGRFA